MLHEDDRWVLTADNDGNIFIWDLLHDKKSTSVTTCAEINSFIPTNKNPKKCKGKQRLRYTGSNTTANTSEIVPWTRKDILTLREPSLGITHNQKPNSITSSNFAHTSNSNNCHCSATIFVVDTTNDTSLYTIR
jgi:hypothetical protein